MALRLRHRLAILECTKQRGGTPASPARAALRAERGHLALGDFELGARNAGQISGFQHGTGLLAHRQGVGMRTLSLASAGNLAQSDRQNPD
jgi:hypothetical protein